MPQGSCSLEYKGTSYRAEAGFIIQVNAPIYMQMKRQLRQHNFQTSVWSEYLDQFIVLKSNTTDLI